uniref:Ovule protein n=1 Tax=Anisakis simplex TaxID=6269 RepID=A0A0M3JCB8_ANISI
LIRQQSQKKRKKQDLITVLKVFNRTTWHASVTLLVPPVRCWPVISLENNFLFFQLATFIFSQNG